MKKEFNAILADLQATLSGKVAELALKETFNSSDQSRVVNIYSRIKGLENSAIEIINNYSNNEDLLSNFKKRAFELKVEINELV